MTSINVEDPADVPPAAAALEAAEVWLHMVGADADAVVIATIAPQAAVGVWLPGREHVGRLAEVDGNGAQVLQAAGPAVEAALLGLADQQMRHVVEAVLRGARLQLLLAPASGDAVLRLVHPAGNAAQIAALAVERVVH